MRLSTLTFFLCLVCNVCLVAQPQGFSQTKLDSLEKRLATLPNDTNRINTLSEIGKLYSNTNVEKSILLGEEALTLTRKLNYDNGFRNILGPLSFQYSISGQWAKGLELALEGKERYKNNEYELGNYNNMAQLAYEKQGDYKRCLEEAQENIQRFNNHPEIEFSPVDKWATYMTAADMYSNIQQADSALIYARQSLNYAQTIPFNTIHFIGYAHNAIGKAYLTHNLPDSAIVHFHIMRTAMAQINNQFALQETQIYLAKAMQKKGVLDSVYYYAKTAYDGAVKLGNDVNEMNAALILSQYFEKSNASQSLFYLKSHNTIKEKLFTQDQTNKRYFLESEQRNKLAELEKKELNTKNRIRQNTLLGGLFTFILLAGVLIYTNRRRKLLNNTLQQQKLQIENQNQDLVNSSHELELKNRDLEIEAALDKVRTRSLEMHDSNEIQDVAYVLYNELKKLNFQFGACSVYLIDEQDNIEAWVAGFEASEYPQRLFVPKFNHPLYNQQIQSYREGKKYDELYLTPEIKQTYDDHMFIVADYKKLKPELQNMMRTMPSAIFSLAYNKYGALHWGPSKLTEAEASIFQKFSTVFEQSYTRFLDLQKAEAQAREAQIEAALEKVRSQTMAMHKSEDLVGVINVVAEQLHQLNFKFDSTSFFLNNESEDFNFWLAAIGQSNPNKIIVPKIDNPVLNNINDAQKKGLDFFADSLTFEEKNAWFQHVFDKSIINEIPEERKKYLLNTEGYARSVVLMKHIGLFIVNFIPKPYTNEENAIFKRFAYAFEQAYVRFLDLQKAEAQTREAQIEAGLEKIRSRSLAMHRSDELKDVIAIMLDKLKELNVLLGTVAIQFFDEKTKNSFFWVGSDLNDKPRMIYLPYDGQIFNEDTYLKDSWQARITGEEMINKKYSFEQKNKYFEYVFTNNDLTVVPQPVRDFIMQAQSHITCLFIEKNSSLFADSWNGQVYSEDKIEVLRRVAKVFEQAYIRFLDLQKAEAQAREAQIETALERVRSRTMAMQRSDELQDAAALLFQQVQTLGVRSFACGFNIWDDDRKAITQWMAQESVLQPPFKVPTSDDIFSHIHEAAQRGEPLFVIEQNGKELQAHYEYMATIPVFKGIMDNMANDGLSVPTHQIIHCAFFSQGYLMFISYEPAPAAYDIFIRFAKVFEQTYTRFLDLQKAEAQAREAQIETALERVRARALAMHNSNELQEVTHELRKQLGQLGQKELETVAIHLYDESPDYVHAWAAIRPPLSMDEIFESSAKIPKKGLLLIEELLENYYAKNGEYIVLNEKEKAVQWLEFLKQEIKPEEYQLVTEAIKDNRDFETRVWWSCADFQGGSLIMITTSTPHDASRVLLKKFANVFGFAYRRFVDLKQAEAQAREAQIELALEKVRSRSISMMKTDEISHITALLFSELRQLDLTLDRSVIITFDTDLKGIVYWLAGPEGLLSQNGFHIPLFEHSFNQALIDNYKNKTEKWIFRLEGDNKKKWDNIAFAESDLQHLPDFIKDSMINYGDVCFSMSSAGYGALMISGREPVNDVQFDLALRFSKVFDQSYTRFLDLQKAEAQAREAKIEAALEKIRSRSLAMHRSDELKDVIAVMFEKMKELDVVTGTIALQFFDEETKNTDFWVSNDLQHVAQVKLPYDESFFKEDTYMKDCWEAKAKGENIINRLYTFEQKNAWFDYTFAYNDFETIPPPVREFIKQAPNLISNLFIEKNSALYADNWFGQYYSNDKIDVLKRVAKVFDQAYVRFLDLQRAEAQAREAEIELSLERVRARTMAMHHSNELGETAKLLFQQVQALRIPAWSCGYNIWEKGEKVCTGWMSSNGILQPPFKIPLTESPSFIRQYESKQKGEDFYIEEVSGEALAAHYQYMGSLPDFGEILKDFLKSGFTLPNSQINHIVNFKQGNMVFITGEPVPEAWDIFKRFAKVFEQTYTRFLDLQKAEAQAREAQIEVAVERVRTQSMVMNKTSDLSKVNEELLTQLRSCLS